MKNMSAGRVHAGLCFILLHVVLALAGCGVVEPDAGEEALSNTASELLTQAWNQHLDAQAAGLAVDGSGNVYVTGFFQGTLDGAVSVGGEDVFLTKYDPNGNKLWVPGSRVAGTPQYDKATAITVDPSGFVYIAGFTGAGCLNGSAGYGMSDVFVRKYDPSGNRVWDRCWGGQWNDEAYGIATDGASVYVTGLKSTGTGSVPYVLKLDAANGAIGWAGSWSSSEDNTGYAFGVAIDASGNVYVAGQVWGNISGSTNSGYSDLFLAKVSSSGAGQWARLFGTSGYDAGAGVAVDANGVYVTGYASGNLGGDTNAGGKDVLIAKYDLAGTLQWAHLLGTASNDEGTAIRTYGGDVFIAGSLGGSAFMGRYNSRGIRLASETKTGAKATGLALDGGGRLHVAGFDSAASTSYSSFVTKFTTSLMCTSKPQDPASSSFDNIYYFTGSGELWQHASCFGAYEAYADPNWVVIREVYGGWECDPSYAGNLELNLYHDFPNTASTFRVRGSTRSWSSYYGPSNVTHRCVKLLNKDNGLYTVLAAKCDVWPYRTDSYWTSFDYDFTSAVKGVNTVRVVVGMDDAWSANWDEEIWIDTMRVSGNIVCGDLRCQAGEDCNNCPQDCAL